jgi:hypothetical protein
MIVAAAIAFPDAKSAEPLLPAQRTGSPFIAALTRFAPSDIVRSPPITHRTVPRTAHARRVAHFATPAVAFISQVPPLAP